jgi:hypothetical protein
MLNLKSFFIIFNIGILLSPGVKLFAQDIKKHKEKKIDCILRLGQGGFRDSRSPIGKLGGGQIAIDIKPRELPFAFSVSSEYYTNSPEPTHSYEIESLVSGNLLYVTPLFNSERANFFGGGGIGILKVPGDEQYPGKRVESILYNLEAGIHIKVFWRLGLYATAKYLNAQKKERNIKVIDFKENIVLVGFTFNFAITR